MAKRFKHLGPFSDLVTAAGQSGELYPMAKPGRKTQRLFKQALAFAPREPKPIKLKTERTWTADGVDGTLLTWSVGYGPRTEAYLLCPAGEKGKLPGVLALHDHGGFKYFGKEKLADGPNGPAEQMADYRRQYYGGRAWATELAREGFCVLVPDVFLWGSRRFPLSAVPQQNRDDGRKLPPIHATRPADDPIGQYNAIAGQHEHTVAKYCNVLGTSLAGIIAYEDAVAAVVLTGRKNVRPGGIGCAGLSGGGLQSVLLQATCPAIRAAVVVGAMYTFAGLLDHDIVNHSWMLFPPDWPRYGEWPDAAACRAPSPLMVQYDSDDALFSPTSMRAAHRRLAMHYRNAGAAENYCGKFYPGPHKFDLAMQADAFAWLKRQLVK